MTSTRTKTSAKAAAEAAGLVSRGRLVSILQERIRSLKLKPGDPFLSVRQIADDYQISPATAHKGMKILADKGWLETRARSGAIIGPAVLEAAHLAARVDTIQVFIGQVPMTDTGLLGPGVCEGLVAAWPTASIQLNSLPKDEAGIHLDKFFGATSDRTRIVGAVVTRCPRTVKQRFLKCDFPVVVIGHVDDDIDIPFVDRDQFSIGRTLASHLFDRGHKDIGVLMYSQWMPGDNPFLSGVQSAAAERNISADRLRIHSVTTEPGSLQVAFDGMQKGPSSVSALICRSDRIAVECLAAAKERRLRVPDDLAIVSAGQDTVALIKSQPTITGMSHDGEMIGRLVGELLVKLNRGEPLQRKYIELPSQLIHRESS